MSTVIITGVGGQGILTLAKIIGDALVKKDLRVRVAEVHGMAQRGGSVVTYVRYGNIDCPRPSYGMADAVISLEMLECLRSLYFLKKNGTIVVNDWIYPPNIPGVKVPSKDYILKYLDKVSKNIYVVPANQIADSLGSRLIANTVILGAVARLKVFPLSKEDLIESLRRNIKKKYIDLNLLAFEKGFESISV